MTAAHDPPIALRHEMAEAALARWSPLLQYSDISKGTNALGEQALHDIRRLNRDRELDIFAIWGGETEERLRFILRTFDAYSRPCDLVGQANHHLALAVIPAFSSGHTLTPSRCLEIASEVGFSWPIRVLGEVSGVSGVNSTLYRQTLDPALVPPEVDALVRAHGLYGKVAQSAGGGD